MVRESGSTYAITDDIKILSLLHPRLAHSYLKIADIVKLAVSKWILNLNTKCAFSRFRWGGGSNRVRAVERLWWGQRKIKGNASDPDHCV